MIIFPWKLAQIPIFLRNAFTGDNITMKNFDDSHMENSTSDNFHRENHYSWPFFHGKPPLVPKFLWKTITSYNFLNFTNSNKNFPLKNKQSWLLSHRKLSLDTIFLCKIIISDRFAMDNQHWWLFSYGKLQKVANFLWKSNKNDNFPMNKKLWQFSYRKPPPLKKHRKW